MKDSFAYNILKYLLLFSVGGMIYVTLELLFRGRSDVTMMYCGAICFVFIGLINNLIPWTTAIWKQAIIGGVFIITPLEYIFGLLFNQDYHIWDYRDMMLNINGHVCLEFTLLWCLLSIIGIVLDDYLRHLFFDESKPYYYLF